MKHLIITIELVVDDSKFDGLTKEEAKESAKQAYIAARKALPHFTAYDENDFCYEIES